MKRYQVLCNSCGGTGKDSNGWCYLCLGEGNIIIRIENDTVCIDEIIDKSIPKKEIASQD